VKDKKQGGVASEAEEEQIRAQRRLREEQDAEFQVALLQDQERENRRRQKALWAAQKKREEEEKAIKKEIALDNRRREKGAILENEPELGPSVTKVRVRLPNGERKERMFLNTSRVQAVYDYVDTLMCFDKLSYTLLFIFPRVVYGARSRDMTLNDVGFHPCISLFVQFDG